ncbi:MAG TPA: HEAT repeat domain-containing protein [Gemmataceae bacterium]|nr:HEAT repeat domain-containing protein [Gemmataceae bacterium]
MLPIQSLSPSLASRLTGLVLIVLLAGFVGWASAAPLPENGVKTFQDLLDKGRTISSEEEPSLAAEHLAEHLRELRAAANERTLSLGELTQVLLLQDWGIFELTDLNDKNVDFDQVKAAVGQNKETSILPLLAAQTVSMGLLAPPLEMTPFYAASSLLPKSGDLFKDTIQGFLVRAEDTSTVVRMISYEIKRDVRQRLVQRLLTDIRPYLRSSRPGDRVAAANLISQTMSESRRLSAPEEQILGDKSTRTAILTSRFLREELSKLAGDVKKLTEAGQAVQVQVAGVHALSELSELGESNVLPELSEMVEVKSQPESSLADTMTTIKRLLMDRQSDVLVRRAAAETLAHMIDLVDIQWKVERNRPQPSTEALGKILPVAAGGLDDSDAKVRRLSLLACQRAVTTLDDLVGYRKVPLGQASMYTKLEAVLRESLPRFQDAAENTEDPELRIAACHLLETLVEVWQKLPHPKEVPAKPRKEPAKGIPIGVPLSSIRGSRRLIARSSQWAIARPEEPTRTTLLAPVPLRDEIPASSVTLDRPVKLSTEAKTLSTPPASAWVSPAAFVAPRIDDLHRPTPVAASLEGVIKARIARLNDPDYRVRLASVDVLEVYVLKERAIAVIPDLVTGLSKKGQGLSDPNKFVRWASARTLGRIADRLKPQQAKVVVPGLRSLLNDREDQSVRIAAASAIAKYGDAAGDDETVRHLGHVINRGDKEYILEILHTIQGIGTKAVPALPSVAWIMSNRELPTTVRVEAAQTLGRFGPLAKGQRDVLRKIMIDDPSSEVRNAASIAVLAIDSPK